MTDYKKCFIDTAPYIYYLEQNPAYFETVKGFVSDAYKNNVQMVTSTITIEEYGVGAFKEKDDGLLKKFYQFLSDTGTHVVEIDRQIAEKAACIRAEYGKFKAMDALQLAAAVTLDCDLFLTNDRQLKQFEDISCATIDELKM